MMYGNSWCMLTMDPWWMWIHHVWNQWIYTWCIHIHHGSIVDIHRVIKYINSGCTSLIVVHLKVKGHFVFQKYAFFRSTTRSILRIFENKKSFTPKVHIDSRNFCQSQNLIVLELLVRDNFSFFFFGGGGIDYL